MNNFNQKNKSKRPARVFAMQLLYAMEQTAGTVADCISGVLKSQEIAPEMKAYGISLVDLVQEHKSELDEIITSFSKSWPIERMAIVDVNTIRIALTELLYKSDVPVKVVIKEAVEIVVKYSTADSSSFVNGILNSFARSKNMLG